MTTVIGTYDYTYGSGNQPNRRIQFSRTGAGARTIQAHVFVLLPGVGIGAQTSTVPGDRISAEMESTTTKMHAMMTGRDLEPPQSLSDLNVLEQNVIMQSLVNRGVEVENGRGVLGGLEVVRSLNIFDPR